MNKKNHGAFNVSLHMLDNAPDEIAEVLAFIKFVPTETKVSYYTQTMLYVGMSSHFKELKEGEICPMYTLEVTKNDAKEIASVKVTIEPHKGA